jgi:hypothetical protein
MPWQAQLFIGVPVHDDEEVREVFQKLGRHDLDADDLEEELCFSGTRTKSHR